jgi:8-oxo-dGTP pyrophosphatase MutT (NUDIX family)
MDYIRWIRSKVGQEKIILSSADAVIFNDQGQVLLQKRSDNLNWGLIAGMMELGETIQDTLRREIFEETGLTKYKIIKLLGVYTTLDFTYPNGDQAQTNGTTFLVKPLEKVNLDYTDQETLALRWFNPDHLDVDLSFEQHRQVINDFQKWWLEREV